MTQTRRGTKVWTLISPRARVLPRGGAVIESPEIRFFRDGVHATTALAREAVVDDASKDVALRGDVVIAAHKEKTRLMTESLNYSSSDERFRTEERVVIERPDARIIGRGIEADAALTDVTIRRQETTLR